MTKSCKTFSENFVEVKISGGNINCQDNQKQVGEEFCPWRNGNFAHFFMHSLERQYVLGENL